MSNDYVGALAGLLINYGETGRYAKKKIFDEGNQLLIELEKTTHNFIQSTIHFFDATPLKNNVVSEPFKNMGNNYIEYKTLIGQNRSRISKELYEILCNIEVTILRQLRTPEQFFLVKNVDLDKLQEKFVTQLKKDRKQLVKGKI